MPIEDMKDVRKILETPFWPTTLKTEFRYFRMHDDCDGETRKGIEVIVDQQGDVWVAMPSMGGLESCRFRTWGGGGASLRVRNAMLILAEAIRLDNENGRPACITKPE